MEVATHLADQRGPLRGLASRLRRRARPAACSDSAQNALDIVDPPPTGSSGEPDRALLQPCAGSVGAYVLCPEAQQTSEAELSLFVCTPL